MAWPLWALQSVNGFGKQTHTLIHRDLFVVVQSFSHIWLSVTHELQHTRLPCPSPSPRAYSNSCPLGRWCHPTISSSVVPFSSCLPSFPASESFLISQLFASGGQSIGASTSASILSVNIQGWSPLGETGLIPLQSKGLSRVFSNTTVQKINHLALSLLSGPALKSIHDFWKNHSFDYMYLCWQSNVSTF